MMEPFGRLLGRESGAITAVGGGAQSDVWCQIIADICGRPIRQLASPIQANAIGAAFIAGVGIGALRFNDLSSLRHVRRTYEPDATLRRLYDDKFETFKEVRTRLAPLYRRLNPPEVSVPCSTLKNVKSSSTSVSNSPVEATSRAREAT
jgi:xylulokinase